MNLYCSEVDWIFNMGTELYIALNAVDSVKESRTTEIQSQPEHLQRSVKDVNDNNPIINNSS